MKPVVRMRVGSGQTVELSSGGLCFLVLLSYKSLFMLTPKNIRSYLWVFTVVLPLHLSTFCYLDDVISCEGGIKLEGIYL